MAQNENKDILAAKQQFSIVGNSSALNNAIERALKVAPFDLSVLIIGESGSGKEFFPQIIHKYSKRKNKKYTVVNCGAIPEGTIESELFGHVKGAFTGADKDRKGYFEETNGGTIFLDEVAEMPLATQARLLRVLQNGEYIKVGSDVVQKTDVRIVAATNKNLKDAVREGRFREDLYYRLSTIQIDIPALRERADDIKMIVRVFAHDFADKYNTPPVKFSESALNALTMYSWPGNVRELKSIIERICVYEGGKEIDADIIAKYIPQDTVLSTSIVATKNHDNNNINGMLLEMIKNLFNEVNELKKKINNYPESTHIDNRISQPATVSNDTKDVYMHEDYLYLDSDKGNDTKVDQSYASTEVSQYPVKSAPHGMLAPIVHNVGDDSHKYRLVDVESSDEEFKSLEEIEKEAIEQALVRNNGKRKITADQLKISERTLYRKIEEYKLNDKCK